MLRFASDFSLTLPSQPPSTTLSEPTTTIRCASLPRSRGETLRPRDFSHRLCDEKSLVCLCGRREERGHASQPVPVARVQMRCIALCVVGEAVYDATGRALTVR